MLEKFSCAEELEKSYMNLEKEFTKKCQELASLKKELVESVGVNEPVLDENEPLEDEVQHEEVCVEAEDNSSLCDEKVLENLHEKSVFGVDFRAKAGEFLKNNDDAKQYAKDISKLLIKDKSLLNCSDPFMVAYAMVLKDQLKSKPQVDDVCETEDLKEVVPKKSSVEVLPLISKTMVGGAPFKSKPKFRTLEDARNELMNRYFV